jgi:hypothetical protein
MAVRLKYEGVTVECDTAEEAVEYEQLRQGGWTPKASSAPAPKPPAEREVQGPEDDARSATAFRVIAAAGTKGVPTDDLVPKLHLPNGRALSGVTQAMRRRLALVANGTPVDELLWSKGKPGNRRWFVNAAKLKELGLVQ